MTYTITRGDTRTLTIPLVLDGVAFAPGANYGGIFTAKFKSTDADVDAAFQHATGGNLSFSGTNAILVLNAADTDALSPQSLITDIQLQHATTGAILTFGPDRLKITQDITREVTTSVPPNNTETPMPFGITYTAGTGITITAGVISATGGGGGTWGTITGTLSAQTDLAAALALKAPLASPSFTGTVTTTGDYASIYTSGLYSSITTSGDNAIISTDGSHASISTTGAEGYIYTTGIDAFIRTIGPNAAIYTAGTEAYIYTTGANAYIATSGANAFIETAATFNIATAGGTYKTIIGNVTPTVGNQTINFPNTAGVGGTIALTSDIPAAPTAASIATALGIPTFADLTAANASGAISIGKPFYNTALTKLDITTA